jgi:rhodanese-related sulfurtransferase
LYTDFSPEKFLAEYKANGSWQLLDVREPREIEIVAVPGSIKIPFAEVPSRQSELDADKPVAVLSHAGGRSAKMADYLSNQGFSRVANIAGGIDAWARDVDNSLPRY